MLIALFTVLAAVLFTGGNNSPYINPNAEKLIKQNIEDSDRKKEILTIMKDYKKEWKELNKLAKKQAKAIHKMNKDRNVASEAIAAAFQEARQGRLGIEKKLIETRLAVQPLITQTEWDHILEEILVLKPKKEKKQTKAEMKEQLRQNKQLTAIGDEIEAAFDDPAKRKQATADLLTFEESLSVVLEESQSYNYRDQEALKNKEATREELEAILDNLSQVRAASEEAYLILRTDLIELSTEDNWPKLAKALGKFF